MASSSSASANSQDGTIIGKNRPNKYTIISCIIASSGALLFGLDVGITGGVLAMPSFLEKFFPDIYAAAELENEESTNAYCAYDSQLLSLFTSSFFLAGMATSLPASWVTEKYGRKASMALGAALYLLGSTLNVVAVDTAMLIIGRLILGAGCGFINQSVPIFLAEVPPPEFRGAIQTCFQIFVNIGILLAGIINYYTSRLDYGWRISLGVFIPPALLLLVGSFFMPGTPAFLYRSGNVTKAKETLKLLRHGSSDETIDEEWNLIEKDVNESKEHGTPSQQLKTLLSRPYRGELTVAAGIAFFSQFTGVNSITYYAPELFKTMGFGSGLGQAIAVAGVLLAGALTSFFVIDRVGRRALLIGGGSLLFAFQLATALVMRYKFDPYNPEDMAKWVENLILALICLFTYCFGWSWGPLGWIVPVESQSQATRSAASTMSVLTNFFAVFVTTQFFLPMLCKMQWGTFLFYAMFDVAMVIFSWLFVVETKGVPVEKMRSEFQSHRYWKRYAIHAIDEEVSKPAPEVELAAEVEEQALESEEA